MANSDVDDNDDRNTVDELLDSRKAIGILEQKILDFLGFRYNQRYLESIDHLADVTIEDV